MVGGRSVGVPGMPRLLETVHKRFGNKPWAGLFAPAIELSEDGFNVSAWLNTSIAEDLGRLDQQPSTRAYFFDAAGAPLAAGTLLINQPYAETLQAIAAGGAELSTAAGSRKTSSRRSTATRPTRAGSASPTSPPTR